LENLRDTPNSISILNRELIDDLAATSVGELMSFAIAGEISDNVEFNRTSYDFRGTAGTQLRNGILWLLPKDTFNLERVEVLRGPTAFLYGEGNPSGALNQVTKQAQYYPFEKVQVSLGSQRAARAELDVNRRLSRQFGARLSLVHDEADGYVNYTRRDFNGLYLALNYRPFAGTNLSANFEYGRNHEIRASNLLADRFSTTARTGATSAYAVTNGGLTFFPALGRILNTVGSRFSAGTGIAVTDDAVLPRQLNFQGPDSYFRQHYDSLQVLVEQRVSANFNLQASAIVQNTNRYLRTRAGSLSAGVYLDTNRTLPDGTANPNLNRLYTEFYERKQFLAEPQKNLRLTAVYDLKTRFTTQRILAMGQYHGSTPSQRYHAEFGDPASTSFAGTLRSDNSLAAYQANLAVLQRNYFYRRFYIGDGDGATLTQRGVVPGRSVILRDITAEGASGHQTRRNWRAPAYGLGASGSYLKGRLRTLVGWRRDSFLQSPTSDFYNHVTGETYYLPTTPEVRNRFFKTSTNLGAVVHLAKFVSAHYNYAESVNVSNGPGGAGMLPGSVRGLLLGDGREMGLRWSFLEGRLESNWTYYVTKGFNNNSNPAVPTNVKNELAALFPELVTSGIDTQSTVADGFEFETVANLTKAWRLTWNCSTNDLETSDRFPQLRSFRERAQQANRRIPETDSFLASNPEGTPIPGFTRKRSNLVTNYSFSTGALKGFSIGGGFQYRDRGYRGNFDLNGDGVAEMLWTPSYVLWNAMAGYRTTLLGRKVDFRFNLNNVFDRAYFRSVSLASGSWAAERNFRLTARIDL
jgi:outer membrane receptor protein involved in Fe transport